VKRRRARRRKELGTSPTYVVLDLMAGFQKEKKRKLFFTYILIFLSEPSSALGSAVLSTCHAINF